MCFLFFVLFLFFKDSELEYVRRSVSASAPQLLYKPVNNIFCENDYAHYRLNQYIYFENILYFIYYIFYIIIMYHVLHGYNSELF